MTIPTATASTRNASTLPWMALGLFDHAAAAQADTSMGLAVNPAAYTHLEVRPVCHDARGHVVALTRGDGTKPDFWSIYLRDAEGLATCVADLPSDIAADRLAEALMATYPGLSGASGIHSPIRASDEAEAAQCLWEGVLNAAGETGSPNLPEWVQWARHALENWGHAEVRAWMRDLARPCLVAWNRAEHLHDYDGECFDWVYVPKFLASLDWTSLPGHCPTVDPTWLPVATPPAVQPVMLAKVEPVAAPPSPEAADAPSEGEDIPALPLRTFVIDVARDGGMWTYEGTHRTEDEARAAAVEEINSDWGKDWADWDEMAADVDATAIDAHPDVMAPRLPADAVDAYRRLADGLSDMVEEGRLNEGDIPDDYRWLVEQLATVAGLDPIRTKTVMAFGPAPVGVTITDRDPFNIRAASIL